MKKILLTIFIIGSKTCFSQHLKTVHDFGGDDFSHSTQAMVAAGDSIYAITRNAGDNNEGSLFRVGKDGQGYTIIKSFGADASVPLSLVGNDSIIYGTTRDSESGSGKLFKYSLQTYEFEFVSEFLSAEGQSVNLKYITDSVFWGYANESAEDAGNIFTLNKDGSSYTKIYNDTDFEKGQNPSDIHIVDDKIFIAFFNGGGIPYEDGSGSTSSSGSVGRVDIDGTNFLTIKKGEDQIGTQPQALINYEDKVYGVFASAGTSGFGRFYRMNFDGTEYEEIASTSGVGRGKLVMRDGLIYGVSSNQLFSYNLTGSIFKALADFDSATGVDIVAGPTISGESFIVANNQGGTDGGGNLLEWSNSAPMEVGQLSNLTSLEGFGTFQINFNERVSDSNGDDLEFTATLSREDKIEVSFSEGILTITELATGVTDITVNVDDSFGGILQINFIFDVNALPKVVNQIEDQIVQVGFSATSLSLENVFLDLDDAELIYSIESSNIDAATLSIVDNTVLVTEVGAGSTTATLTASDGRGGNVVTSFEVLVNASPEFTSIANILINEGFISQTLNLLESFSDANEDVLTFTISSSNEDVISTSIQQDVLTINEVGFGESTISIIAEDENGGSAMTSFQFEINAIPDYDNTIANFLSRTGYESFTIDLSEEFTDRDGDQLSITASIDNATVATLSLSEEQILTVTEGAVGSAIVTIIADDGRGGTAIANFTIDVVLGLKNDKNIVSIYPNPVSSILKIDGSKFGDKFQILIYNINGQVVLKKTSLPSKLDLDVSNLTSGQYILSIKLIDQSWLTKIPFIKN